MLVQSGLENNARSRRGKTAVVAGGRRYTYAELDAMANRLANALAESGVRRGDRVAIFLPNCAEAVAAIYGALKAGAVFVVINRSTKPDRLAHILEHCGAAALVTDARGAGEYASRARTGLRALIVDGRETPAGALGFRRIQETFSPAPPRIANIDLDLACLIYTSGSTGEPHAVMSDHSNMLFAANSIITYLKNEPSDVVIDLLPLSFDYGLYQLIMTMTFGGTLVLETGFAYPVAILERIAAERVTGFPGVPTIFAALLNMDLSGYDLSSLRYITNTAAALPPAHIEQLRRKFPGVTLYSMYGLTETKRTLYLPPEQLEKRPGSVGIAIPGTEVWIEGPDGSRLGPHQVGELVVRGRHVMRGYWNDPEATAARFRPGPVPGERLCYTGDLFTMDEGGYMYFVARKDDIIKTRGEKVAPREIENVLHALPGVREAAVVGVPDELLGQAIKAVIVADTDRVTRARVKAWCRAKLEDFKVPKYVEFRESLPRSSSGKVVKQAVA